MPEEEEEDAVCLPRLCHFKSLTYYSMSFDDTVTIVVGREKRRFVAPKNVLCRSSPFFRAALSGNWSETKQGGCLTMPDDDSDTCTAYLQWSVSGEVVVHEDEADSSNLVTHFEKLLDLYVFADKVGDGKLQNAVIDRLHQISEQLENLPGERMIKSCMSRLPEDCMLLEWLVDQYAYEFESTLFDADGVAECPRFFARVLSVMAAHRDLPAGPTDRETRCYYHVHNKDNPKCK